MFGLGVGWTSVIVVAIIVIWGLFVVSQLDKDGNGCGCLVVTAIAVVFVGLLIRGCDKESQRQDEMETKRRLEEQEQREREREKCFREFWEREAPRVWTTYQKLNAEIEMIHSRNSELRRKLELYGRNHENNDVYRQNLAVISTVEDHRKKLWKKMEDAYLRSVEFKAAPNTRDNEILKGLIEDASQEARADENKFRGMREQK